MTPPQLARHAPRLDVFHPVEEGLLPVFRDDFDLARFHGFDGFLREFFGVHIPLIGQPRFDHHTAAIAKRRCNRARLCVAHDFLALFVFRNMRDEEASIFQPLDHQLACAIFSVTLEAVKPDKFIRH